MITAWYLAIMIQKSDGWHTKEIIGMPSESVCLQFGQDKWKRYWVTGGKTGTDLQMLCYDESYSQRIWLTCTQYGSCTIK